MKGQIGIFNFQMTIIILIIQFSGVAFKELSAVDEIENELFLL